MDKTKFFKRLLSFYMPSKNRFVDLPWTKGNMIYARVGYLLLKTLLKSSIGIKFLVGSDLEMFMTIGSVIVNTDNPFHQKKSFVQDLEQYFEKEFKRFHRSKEMREKMFDGLGGSLAQFGGSMRGVRVSSSEQSNLRGTDKDASGMVFDDSQS